MKKDNITKILLGTIALGIWTIVLQSFGLFGSEGTQRVYVVNEIDANVSGEVDADVSGTVGIDNTVDINIQEINGRSDVFYQDNDGAYMLLPVKSR